MAVPLLHRFVVGSLVVDTPLAEPHCPLTALCPKCRALAGVLGEHRSDDEHFPNIHLHFILLSPFLKFASFLWALTA